MFKLVENLEYDWPVQVRVPADGGKHKLQKFTAKFRAIGQDRTNELMESAGLKVDEVLLREVLVGWGDDVGDSQGKAIAFDDDARDRLLQIPYVRTALAKAYNDSVSGIRAKN